MAVAAEVREGLKPRDRCPYVRIHLLEISVRTRTVSHAAIVESVGWIACRRSAAAQKRKLTMATNPILRASDHDDQTKGARSSRQRSDPD